MKEKVSAAIPVDTVIIGAGISGLACARRLHQAGKDFIIVSKDIGGRVRQSKADQRVGLGGVYINSDYFNLMPFVDIIEPFRIRDFYFSDGKSYKTLFSLRNIKYVPKLVRFLCLLWRFRCRLCGLRKDAEHEELRVLIEKDPLLNKYWHMSVRDFLKRHGFEELDYIFGLPTAGTNIFASSNELNVFYYLFLFMTMIRPSYIVDLSQTMSRISDGFESSIVLDTVVSIKKQQAGNYLVSGEKSQFLAGNVVIAAPYLDVVGAYDLPKPSRITSTYTYSVVGRRKENYDGKKGVVLHPDRHDAYLLWRQKAGSDLIYAKTGDLDLSRYYGDSVVLEKAFWKTAMHLPGDRVLPQRLDRGLYLASDYNFSLMEDAYITGLYAANQILKDARS
ncbi:MAG TPA: FAD-dependent oxidoreductase [Candidatus Paceibacterota bacterium]|nr:FAD-dependent oxidoreductase [Candidatus Paceibacterota bacterium]